MSDSQTNPGQAQAGCGPPVMRMSCQGLIEVGATAGGCPGPVHQGGAVGIAAVRPAQDAALQVTTSYREMWVRTAT